MNYWCPRPAVDAMVQSRTRLHKAIDATGRRPIDVRAVGVNEGAVSHAAMPLAARAGPRPRGRQPRHDGAPRTLHRGGYAKSSLHSVELRNV